MLVYCPESNRYFRSAESMNRYRWMQAHEAFDAIWKRKIKDRRKL